MNFETCGRASLERQPEQIAPKLQKIFDSLGFQSNPDIQKKLDFLYQSSEAQSWLLPWMENIFNDHQSHMAYIQNNANNWYLRVLNDWVLNDWIPQA